MKKTFLLALVLCLASGFVFASVDTTLQLNLNDATSKLHAGFYDAAAITVEITPSTTSTSIIDISRDDVNLTTNQKTFCIFWYMNAIQDKAGIASLTLRLNPLKSTTLEPIETLNYKVISGTPVKNNVNYEISLAAETEITVDGEEVIEIFEATTNYSGVSSGYIPLIIPAISFTSVHKDIYQATLRLEITAP